MKKTISVIVALIIALSLVAYSFKASPSAASTSPGRWEYTTLFSTPGADLVVEANRLGREGWELVMTRTGGDLWLKRPLP